MFIHLGGEIVVSTKEVIAILHRGKENMKEIDQILHQSEKNKKLIKISNQEDIKSLVVTNKHIYASPISSLTLIRRA